MKFETLHKPKALNLMVTNFFVILDACQYWHLSSFRPQFLTKNGRSSNFDNILYFAQTEGSEFNGDNSFLWFLTSVNIDTCSYWHLSSFRPQFWTKNGKSSNFDEILYFAQTEGGEFNGDNSFLWFLTPVNIDNCQYWYLLSFRSKFSTKNGKCSSFDKILYFTQNEGGEFNGLDIERCNGCRRELKPGNEKQILCQKCYCYITNKTGKKLWLTSVKFFSSCKL